MIDLHQHPMVKPEDPSQLLEYLRGDSYAWGYEAAKQHGHAKTLDLTMIPKLCDMRERSWNE